MDVTVKMSFAQFHPIGTRQERMVHVLHLEGFAQELRQENLPSGGRQDVHPANHQVHALAQIVHHYGKLIGPVSFVVVDDQITALVAWVLHLFAKAVVVERGLPVGEAAAQVVLAGAGQSPFTTVGIVGEFFAGCSLDAFCEHFTGATAGVEQAHVEQVFAGAVVVVVATALPVVRTPGFQGFAAAQVGDEAKLVEVVEDGGFVFGAEAVAVVVLHAEEDLSAQSTGDAPYVNCVEDVSEMEVARGAGGKTSERHLAAQSLLEAVF